MRKYVNTLHSVSIMEDNLSLDMLYDLYGKPLEIDVEEIRSNSITNLVTKFRNCSINDFIFKLFTAMIDHLKLNKLNETNELSLVEFIIEFEKILKGITLSYTYDIYIISMISVAKSYL